MYAKNSYRLSYYVDDEIYAQEEVVYGEVIDQPTPPTKEGYVFEGWEDIPPTMPAHDDSRP